MIVKEIIKERVVKEEVPTKDIKIVPTEELLFRGKTIITTIATISLMFRKSNKTSVNVVKSHL